MEWYEGEVRSLELVQREHPAPSNSILFYGSSSFRLWDIDLFPEMLDTDGRPVREHFDEYGLHLSPHGYRLWKDVGTSHDLR